MSKEESPEAPATGAPASGASQPDKTDLYDFEKRSNRGRGTNKAQLTAAVNTFKTRLGISSEERDHQQELELYAMAYPLNIDWYDSHRCQEEEAYKTQISGSIAITVGALVVIVLLTVAAITLGGSSPLTTVEVLASAVPIVAAAAFHTLRLLGAARSPKARMAVFWKARSALSKRLYDFEHEWKTKAKRREFWAALEADLAEARALGNSEEEDFFATLVDVETVIKLGEGAVNDVAGRSRTFFGQLGERLAAREKVVASRNAAVLGYDQALARHDRAAARKALASAAYKRTASEESRASEERATADLAEAEDALREADFKLRGAFQETQGS